jgi:RNA polymerase sigma-70 factor (ECF subfamily)
MGMTAGMSATTPRPAQRTPVPAADEELALVSRMRAGEEQAFEIFAGRYIPLLYRFAGARLNGQRELTRDVVQSTICKVIEKLDSWRGEASLFTWLAACCRNEIAAHYRRQESRPVLAPIDDEPSFESLEPGPEDQLLASDNRTLVHAVLDQLPPSYASALEWKYLEEVSVDEIARRLALGPKAAESTLTRARNAFRAAYERLCR